MDWFEYLNIYSMPRMHQNADLNPLRIIREYFRAVYMTFGGNLHLFLNWMFGFRRNGIELIRKSDILL